MKDFERGEGTQEDALRERRKRILMGEPHGYSQITQQEAKDIMDREKDLVILDVRTREEYDSGHIAGAVCLPNEEILREPKELPDKGQKILVYCRSGMRSKQAAQKLADMGYGAVLEFGGILDWEFGGLQQNRK